MNKGLGKLETNPGAIDADLDPAWEILAEPIQTVMRRYGVREPYEKLKELTRGREVNAATIRTFLQQLDIPDAARKQLLDLTPRRYTGQAERLANEI